MYGIKWTIFRFMYHWLKCNFEVSCVLLRKYAYRSHTVSQWQSFVDYVLGYCALVCGQLIPMLLNLFLIKFQNLVYVELIIRAWLDEITMKDDGGEDSSTSRNTPSTKSSPFVTVMPNVVMEPTTLLIATVTYVVAEREMVGNTMVSKVNRRLCQE